MKGNKWENILIVVCCMSVSASLLPLTVIAELSSNELVTEQKEMETNRSLTEEKTQLQTQNEVRNKEVELPEIGQATNGVTASNKAINNVIETPRLTYRYGFVNEQGQLVNANEMILMYNSWYGSSPVGTSTWAGNSQLMTAPTISNLKEVVIPSEQVPVYPDKASMLAASDQTFFLPRYYTSLSLYNKEGKIDPTYPIPTVLTANGNNYPSTDSQFELQEVSPNQYGWKTTIAVDANDGKKQVVPLYNRVNVDSSDSPTPLSYFKLSGPVYYHVTNRKVTEHFVDDQGVTISAPPGFTQGKQTSIESDPYTFTQSGTLPDSYTDGTKVYRFQGWYRGKEEPNKLETSKVPSYPVTYDDNDDLTVVYKEIPQKIYTFPSKEVSFGYVDETGNLLDPALFTVQATMGESTETTTTLLPSLVGRDNKLTKLKTLSIPQKVYNLPFESGSLTYGSQSVIHRIPKYYQTISIVPTASYTGDKTKYSLANEVRTRIETPNSLISTVVGTTAYRLNKKTETDYETRQVSWSWDTNKTLYAMGIYSGMIGKSYDLATPDNTIYYYLENRRITETFVDDKGLQITPPDGFFQSKQTVIDSDSYIFKQTGSLPESYRVGEKNIILLVGIKVKNGQKY